MLVPSHIPGLNPVVPNVIVFGGGGLLKVTSLSGWSLYDGVSALVKRTGEINPGCSQMQERKLSYKMLTSWPWVHFTSQNNGNTFLLCKPYNLLITWAQIY